jgi:hypothetical protein
MPMWEGMVGNTWNDSKYKESVLSRGAKRTKGPTETPVTQMPDRVHTCSNCGKTLYYKSVDRCVCSIWDTGKMPSVS